MKKILLMSFFVSTLFTAWAQERTVTGKVTSSEDGSGVPGVSILLKGTTSGTVSDASGSYSLSVPSAGGTLVFSFVGLVTQEVEIGTRSNVDVKMESDVRQLSEVVVTAQNIERNKNELPYSTQSVAGAQITQARSANFVTSLSGRVAGMDVRSTNAMGGSTNVVIRGYKSITGNNQALFVIDGIPVSNANTNFTSTTAPNTNQSNGAGGPDYGNAASDINPDNIASINVLKGAAASALYGSRAANGVIMITTKKGRKNSFDIAINSGVTVSEVNKNTYAKYQNEYGQGYQQENDPPATGPYGYAAPAANGAAFANQTIRSSRFDDDGSYGPIFDGSPVYQWGSLDPTSPTYGQATPWVAAKHTPVDFFETAVSSNQSVMITGGGDRNTFKLGYTRSDEKGILPNSSLTKNLLSFGATFDLTSKLSASAGVNFSNIAGVGRYGTGYNSRNPNEGFRQWWNVGADMKELKEAYFRNKQNISWNPGSAVVFTPYARPIFHDNPYWSRYENYSNDSRNHLYGTSSINYKVASWFDITGRIGYDGTTDLQEERYAVGSVTTAQYIRNNRNYYEVNYDLLANFQKNFTQDVSFRATLGSNSRRTKLNSVRAQTSSGLVVPKLYSLSNSAGVMSPPVEQFERIGVDGLYANTTLGYKEMVFIDLQGRQDRSTTLPQGNNTYYYGSVGGTFVITSVYKQPWLSNAKVRASYAGVGNDAPALSVYDVYDKPANFGSTGAVPLFSLPNIKNNPDLESEKTNSLELGLDADFIDGRVGFEFTAYKTETLNQIIPVNITAAAGYSQRYVNSGQVDNKGLEISAHVTPVKTESFSWTLTGNWTANRNKVVSLYGEGAATVTNVVIFAPQGGVTFNATVGKPYGVLRGYDHVYTNGEPTVTPTGYYQRSASATEFIGNPNPNWLAGISNNLSYKDLSLSFLVDIRNGGSIFSLDQWYGDGTGLYDHSAGVNKRGVASRLPVAEGGGVLLDGVQADGSPNTVYGENQDGNGATVFGYIANGGVAVHKPYVYNGGYVKLREVTLTYALPQSVIGKLKVFKGISLSLIGRNLWIIDKAMRFSDPEESLTSGNTAQGYQSGAYPATRTYGFNVKLNF